MISKATEDARVRAEKIAKNGGSNLGKLKSASDGCISNHRVKIPVKNTLGGGTYNTIDKNKTASTTMRLVYEID